MNFCGNSIIHLRQPPTAAINESRGPIRGFTVAVVNHSRGGLLTICSSRLGVFSRGGGGQFEDLR